MWGAASAVTHTPLPNQGVSLCGGYIRVAATAARGEQAPMVEQSQLDAPYQVGQQVQRKAGWDATVRFDRSRYSLPPEHAGKPVFVEAFAEKIFIRGDLIIAEHQPATQPDSAVVQPSHAAALWQLSLQKPTPAAPSWQLSFSDAVAVTPLTRYLIRWLHQDGFLTMRTGLGNGR